MEMELSQRWGMATLLLIYCASFLATLTNAKEFSILFPKTPDIPPLASNALSSLKEYSEELINGSQQTEFMIPQHTTDGVNGRWFRLSNLAALALPENKGPDSVLLVVPVKDENAWGPGRTLQDFFKMVHSFDYPMKHISIALLTSSASQFKSLKSELQKQIQDFAELTLILRTDFGQAPYETLLSKTEQREKINRTRMLAQYRNYAVLSSLESWHQHVVWIDADIFNIPPTLLRTMVDAEHDIIAPLCVRKSVDGATSQYDMGSWIGKRSQPTLEWLVERNTPFVPRDQDVKHLIDFRASDKPFVPLDSVGGTMLYVRADLHRQGILFPHFFVVDSEWEAEGYDGMEAQGFCRVAKFQGYHCVGMPNAVVFHP